MLGQEIDIVRDEQKLKLQGDLAGLEALEFRRKITSVIQQEIHSFCIDIRQVKKMDLTGFNAVVILKKEVEKRGISFNILSKKDGPLEEYLHLSKLNLNQKITAN